MKTISATEANRDFSKLLERVAGGEAIGITKRGKMVAKLSPVAKAEDSTARKKVREHLATLRARPVLGVPRGTRDELYED